MVNKKQQQLEQKLALLNKGYQQSLMDELVSLRQSVEGLQRSALANSSESLGANLAAKTTTKDIYHRLHKMAGSAGTFGWDAIGNRARRLEACLKQWLDASSVDADQRLLKMLDQDLYAMQQELSSSEQHIIETVAKHQV